MRIGRLNVTSYKGFEATGWINFYPGFNVIIGQNNSGKTALLETLRLATCQPKPHRSASAPINFPPADTIIDVEVITSFIELEGYGLKYSITPIYIPVSNNRDAKTEYNKFTSLREVGIRVVPKYGVHPPYQASSYPTHGLFEPRAGQALAASVEIEMPERRYRFKGVASTPNDNIYSIFQFAIPEKVYVFRAERLNLGVSPPQKISILNPDASNLPTVLQQLSANPKRYERFNRHVSEIFPAINHISVVINESNNFEIKVWSNDVNTEREDLAISLTEGGTGVGKVLAILYVAMTIEAGVIVIDEPNSFLHPGAAKKLISILKIIMTSINI